MNVAKHMAWAMNPNLSAEDFQRLVGEDCRRESERVDKFLASVREVLNDTSLDRKSRRELAWRMLSYLPWILTQ